MRRVLFPLLAALLALPVQAAAPRLVAAGGTATEIVYALGAEKGLVGVDTTSLYPREAMKLPNIGYVRALSAEGILALTPTLVIAAAEAGPPPILGQIAAAGVPILPLADGFSEAAVLARIGQIGAALGKTTEATRLQESVRRDLATARAAVAPLADKPKVLFVLSAQRGLVAAGDDTAAAVMIELAGGRNAVGGYTGYKPVTPEAAFAAAPDIILTGSHVIDALGGVDVLRNHPDLIGTPAAREGRIIVRDAMFMLGFGPRLGAAVLDLAQALHPGVTLPTLAAKP